MQEPKPTLQRRSTDTALHSLVSCIERGFRNKEYYLAAFLDIECAFNNVTPTAINGALTELGMTLTRGTPQGGVLLPLLWVIVVNTLLSLI